MLIIIMMMMAMVVVGGGGGVDVDREQKMLFIGDISRREIPYR